MNWGDADMINLYDQDNNFIAPEASKKEPLGPSYEYHMNDMGCNFAIPFSTFHRYNRTDSEKMNKFIYIYVGRAVGVGRIDGRSDGRTVGRTHGRSVGPGGGERPRGRAPTHHSEIPENCRSKEK